MTISLVHAFQSAIADGGDTSLVQPSDWNAEHTLEMATSKILGRTTAGTGAVEELSVGTGLTLSAGSLAANISDTAYASSWNADTTNAPSKNAVYDKFEALFQHGTKATYWYSPTLEFGGQTTTGAAMSIDTIYYFPILITRTITISDLGARVTTNVAGKNIAIAIYAHDASTNLPTGTPVAATGNISAASAAVVSADITGSDVTLTPGLFWQAVWTDGSVALATYNGNFSPAVMNFAVGTSTLANAINAGGVALTGVTSGETYNASAWPNAASESFTETTGNNRNCPLILMKAV